MSYVIAYNRVWCKNLATKLNKKTGEHFVGIDNEEDLNPDHLKKIGAKTIFFPHWSTIIPTKIYKNYNCIIFHMTDLPYGRGGSPLQNLIVRGHNQTMISAIQCIKEVDAGPIYLKKPLSLEGNAEEIFIRANQIIEEMIVEILETNPRPESQKGDIVKFIRRKPEDGNLGDLESLDEIYNYIRMMDAEGYPSAFIRIGNFKLEFSKAIQRVGKVNANVNITMEGRNE